MSAEDNGEYYTYSVTSSYESDIEKPVIDGVVLIELEPNEDRIELCSGHYLLPSTVMSCLEESLRVKVRYRRTKDGSLVIHDIQNPALMKFSCPCFISFEDGGVACGHKYPLEVVTNQMPDEYQEKFGNTILSIYKRKLRKAVFERIPTLQECPNLQCVNEGIDGIGQVISATTWNLYCRREIFKVPRPFIRECRSCGWVWCSLCKVCYFRTGPNLKHDGTTCRDLIDLSDPTSAESLSRSLIDRVAVKCPKCRINVAVSEGCNSIKCTSCGSFFCYLCRDVSYSTSDACHTHLKRMHGGYYEMSKKVKVPKKGNIDKIMDVRSY